MLKMMAVLAALSLLLMSSAMAESSFGACAADVKSACANIEPGSFRIATCLKQHVTNLSDLCKARLAEITAGVSACRSEVETQCGNERQPIQKVVCIKNALTNLSDGCKAAIAAVVTDKD